MLALLYLSFFSLPVQHQHIKFDRSSSWTVTLHPPSVLMRHKYLQWPFSITHDLSETLVVAKPKNQEQISEQSAKERSRPAEYWAGGSNKEDSEGTAVPRDEHQPFTWWQDVPWQCVHHTKTWSHKNKAGSWTDLRLAYCAIQQLDQLLQDLIKL